MNIKNLKIYKTCVVTSILKLRDNKIQIICKDIKTGKKFKPVSSHYNIDTLLDSFHVGDTIEVLYNEFYRIDGIKIKSIELNVGKMTLFWNLLCKNYDNEYSRREFSEVIKNIREKNKAQ